MKNILFIVAVIISISFISCDFTSEKVKKQAHTIDSLRSVISSLENTIDKKEKSAQDKKQHYDSILSENHRLEKLLTRHVKYIYTVQDDIIREPNGKEWDPYDFIHEYYDDIFDEYIHMDDIDEYIKDNY